MIINELNINGYITFNKSLATEHIDLLDKESRKKDDTEGLQYLLGIQGKDGSWIDYFNDAGNSNVWTTSFVCYFLHMCVSAYIHLLFQYCYSQLFYSFLLFFSIFAMFTIRIALDDVFAIVITT